MSDIEKNGRLIRFLKTEPRSFALQIKDKVLEKLKRHNESIILFGTGELGRKVADTLSRYGVPPVAFIDNNHNLQGGQITGIPVLSLKEVIGMFSGSLIVVTIFTNSPVLNQLKEEGVEAITFPELAWAMPEAFLPFCCLEYPEKIYEQKEDILELAKLWADEESQKEYLGQLEWRISLDYQTLPPHRPAAETYFPKDLFSISDRDVFVDCGSYDGDSIRDFIRISEGKFSHIVAVEPDPANRAKINQWKEGLDDDLGKRISVISEAAGDHEGNITFDAQGSVTSSIGFGSVEVPCARLDLSAGDFHPTIIKMDIEGAEPIALRGASSIIRNDRPILAVRLYHVQEHLWQLPLLIHKLNPTYKLFLRRYSDECWETVCYAIPEERLIS